MIKDYRYLHAKDKFLDFSYLALQDQFSSRDEFISFFETLKNDDQRNLFLKTASFYLFLVKKGDWLVDIPGSNEKIDFYSFLVRRKSNVTFPIKDKNELEQWYRKYKQEFGSIQQAIKFFKSLSSQKKADLIKNLEVKDTKPSIENLSKYLYNLRSKFVHETELIVNMSGRTTISKHGQKFVICKISLRKLMEIFEEGFILFFTQ